MAANDNALKLHRLQQQQMAALTAVLIPPALLYQAVGPHTAALLQQRHLAASDTSTGVGSCLPAADWQLFQ